MQRFFGATKHFSPSLRTFVQVHIAFAYICRWMMQIIPGKIQQRLQAYHRSCRWPIYFRERLQRLPTSQFWPFDVLTKQNQTKMCKPPLKICITLRSDACHSPLAWLLAKIESGKIWRIFWQSQVYPSMRILGTG